MERGEMMKVIHRGRSGGKTDAPMLLVAKPDIIIFDDMSDVPTMDWKNCDHIWVESTGDHDSPPDRSQVECKKCGCPGERDNVDGSVFWPAT